MLRTITKYVCIPLLAFALIATTDTPSVQANDCGFGSYRPYNPGFGSYRSYRTPSFNYHSFPRYTSGYRAFNYHPVRPHLDYHGPRLVPHNGHLDYIPGHFHLHRGGHYYRW